MAKIQRNFVQGKMNKSVDERLVPNGQYIDALNVRLGSTEDSEIGSVENSKGNTQLTTLAFNGTELSNQARCIGAFEDGSNQTIYWFVHDPAYTVGAAGKMDMIVSYDAKFDIITYHVISMDDGLGNQNTILNFNPAYLIHSVNKIENLLFFTDNYNPPRFINVKRNYPNPFGNVDQVTAESLLVIKKPPTTSPSFSMFTAAGENTFLEDKLICFAYRYEYGDNDFSATSQWSKAAFIPSAFGLSSSDYLNEGMQNSRNGVEITFNTGGPLVKGVEVLFKNSGDDVIKVIDNFNKTEFGYTDNQDVTITFDSNQIFTVLTTDQIGRLFDNVPLKATTQTMMGNRLIYGNYFEQYNMVDYAGQPIDLDYSIELKTEDIGQNSLTETKISSDYTFDSSSGTQSIADSAATIDFTDINLIAGGLLELDVTFTHSSFTGTGGPTAQTTNVTIGLAFNLLNDYPNAFAMATSTEFINTVGTSSSVSTIANACTGATWTDTWNCDMPNNLDTYFAYNSGITPEAFPNVGPINIITDPSTPDVFSLQFPAMAWSDCDASSCTPANIVFEYFKIANIQATYRELSQTESLHSDFDYAVGMVYMDEFNRSSPALLAPDASVHVPCSASETKNFVEVTIPPEMNPPVWAHRYKFVLKPTNTTYNTIYTNIFFNDPATNATYLLLEGENNEKVIEGQRLRVKADTNGPVLRCAYATILEKKSQEEGFITFDSAINPGTDINAPAGTYAKVIADDFTVVTLNEDGTEASDLAVIESKRTTYTDSAGNSAFNALLVNIEDPATPGNFIDFDIPQGTRISLFIKFTRLGPGRGNGACERRIYTIDEEFTAGATYSNFADWFNGDNIQQYLDGGHWEGGDTAAGNPPTNEYNSTLYTAAFTGTPNSTEAGMTADSVTINRYRFVRSSTDNGLYFCSTGTESCSGLFSKKKRRSTNEMSTIVFRAESTLIFETEPQEALPDVFFEGDQSYEIINAGLSTARHSGGTAQQIANGNVTQTGVVAGLIKSTLYNCYTFGNGAESYKILDRLGGAELSPGNRVTTVSQQDYREMHRFADLTYSGRFSNESNINRLNEFNLSTSNFKVLEESFGSVQKLFARETDVLVLQEDKISYVLAGKNLLSDSVGGGQITSVPEILGTQIARIEEFGISSNPESFVCYGKDKYFTDAKRGAVILLAGTSAKNEQLAVISELGMRGWFRDLFIENIDTQKLGGYDPYMNEYVLSSNTIKLPEVAQVENCGIQLTLNNVTAANSPRTFNVELGQPVGEVSITYTSPILPAGLTYKIDAVYNGATVTTGNVTTGGTLTFQKDNLLVNTCEISVTVGDVGSTGGKVDGLNIGVSCPSPNTVTVKAIVLTTDANAGLLIRRYYRYNDGVQTFPSNNIQVVMVSGSSNPLVSSFTSVTGFQGINSVPTNGSTVRLGTLKKPDDTYTFDVTSDRFGYLRSATNYNNNSTDINNLISSITSAGQWLTTNISQAPSNYYGEFTMDSTNNDYLYLVYDLRTTTNVSLCYSNTSFNDACCGCS